MLFCRLNDEYGVCLVVSLKIACWNMTLVFMVNVASQFEDCVSGFRNFMYFRRTHSVIFIIFATSFIFD